MAKVKGHRANKPNDSFGTINNSNLYRGAYKEDVYKDDEDEAVLADQETTDPSEEATQDSGFTAKSKTDDVDYKKRYDDLKRHYDAKLAEWKDEKEELASQGMESPELDVLTRLKAPKSMEELEQFKEQYPDVYGIVETVSALQADSTTSELRGEVEKLREREKDMEIQKAYQELLRYHEDFDELRNDDKFLGWLDEQPATLSDGIYKNNTDAKMAARVIDLYKADVGVSSNNNRAVSNRKLDAAQAVLKTKTNPTSINSGNQKIWKMSEIQNMKTYILK